MAPPFVAIAPGAVKDEVAPGADRPLPLPRSTLVGRLGPYGVRDPSSAAPRGWNGVVRVVHDPSAPSEAPEDPAEPATTAVKGMVVGTDGTPIGGADVILYSSFYVRHSYYDHRVRQIGRTRTTADGVFDLRPIALDTVHFGAGGDVLVTVRHAAYADVVAQSLPAIVPGKESDVGRLVMPPRGVTVRGTVLDLAGKPVEGAVVSVSGLFNPIEYDKTERRVVLDECPAATTDALGRYILADFAPGEHEISVHVRIDCVLHVRERWQGDREWSPRVRAGNAIKGVVVDPRGDPVAAAVVEGGGNWTPTNADGTFWLDNVFPGPLRLQVFHHAWHTLFVDAVPTNGDDVTLAFVRPLSRVTWTVLTEKQEPVPVVAIDWSYPPGFAPGPFAPDSRYWHDPRGVFEVIVPEGATAATLSDSTGASAPTTPEDLADGARKTFTLVKPVPAR